MLHIMTLLSVAGMALRTVGGWEALLLPPPPVVDEWTEMEEGDGGRMLLMAEIFAMRDLCTERY